MPIPNPTRVEQSNIASVLDGVDAKLEQEIRQTNVLKYLKKSTADALLTGRVRATTPIVLEGQNER